MTKELENKKNPSTRPPRGDRRSRVPEAIDLEDASGEGVPGPGGRHSDRLDELGRVLKVEVDGLGDLLSQAISRKIRIGEVLDQMKIALAAWRAAGHCELTWPRLLERHGLSPRTADEAIQFFKNRQKLEPLVASGDLRTVEDARKLIAGPRPPRSGQPGGSNTANIPGGDEDGTVGEAGPEPTGSSDRPPVVALAEADPPAPVASSIKPEASAPGRPEIALAWPGERPPAPADHPSPPIDLASRIRDLARRLASQEVESFAELLGSPDFMEAWNLLIEEFLRLDPLPDAATGTV